MIKQDLKITLNFIKQVKTGNNVTISGKFSDAANVIKANSKLKLYVNGKFSSIKTDNDGLFTYSTKVTKVGNNIISISYSGGANYNPVKLDTTFKVVQ